MSSKLRRLSRRSENPKRRLRADSDPQTLKKLATRVRYAGSPYHKRHPGDFGLTPPSAPRPDKTLCDGAGILERAQAQRLLREGVKRGLISDRTCGEFPRHVWCVVNGETVVEATLDNQETGTYHGYPLTVKTALRRPFSNIGKSDDRLTEH